MSGSTWFFQYHACIDEELTKRISGQRRLTKAQINNWIRRSGFRSRFGDIREYYATFMTKWLTQPEIDFLQGRVSTNVFMTNYFNPALIADLRHRVLEGTVDLKHACKNIPNHGESG